MPKPAEKSTIHPDTLQQPRAVIYCRVSSARQVEEGHGLESQATRCREYAQRKGYEVVKTFYECGVSGGQLDRPSFNELITFIGPGSEAIKADAVAIAEVMTRFVDDAHPSRSVCKPCIAFATGSSSVDGADQSGASLRP